MVLVVVMLMKIVAENPECSTVMLMKIVMVLGKGRAGVMDRERSINTPPNSSSHFCSTPFVFGPEFQGIIVMDRSNYND